METSTVQVAIWIVGMLIAAINGAAVVAVIKAKAETASAMASLETKIKDWIRDQRFVTKEDLEDALKAFSAEFEARLIDRLNRPNTGFQPASVAKVVEQNWKDDIRHTRTMIEELAKELRKEINP